jgi:hypothetical protein
VVIHPHLILQRKIVNKVFRTALTGLASFALVLGVFSAPASAATITDATATSSAAIGTSGTNATPITVTAKLITLGGGADTLRVALPQNWSFTSRPNNSCTGQLTHNMTGSPSCLVETWGISLTSANDFSTADSISVTFPANVLTVASGRFFVVSYRDNSVTNPPAIDSGNATLSVVEPTPASGGTTTGDGTTAGGGTNTSGGTQETGSTLPAQALAKAVPAKAKAGKSIKIAAVTNAKVATKVTVKGKGCKVAAVKDKKNKKKIASYKVTMGKKGATCTVTVTAPATATVAALNSVTAIKAS